MGDTPLTYIRIVLLIIATKLKWPPPPSAAPASSLFALLRCGETAAVARVRVDTSASAKSAEGASGPGGRQH